MNDGETLLYRASKADCDACALRSRCCPNTPARTVQRSIARRRHARDLLQPLPAKKEMLLPIEGSVLVNADGVSVDEMVDSVQSDEPDNDKVDGNDVI